MMPVTRTAQVAAALTLLVSSLLATTPAAAQRIENPVAVFAALDKVTARISRLEVELSETKTFGALKVTPRICYTRPPTEPPKTTAFVQVDEVKLNGEEERIFSGWMLAESPGVNGVEHPVFDVWLTGCASRKGTADEQTVAVRTEVGRSSISEGMPLPLRRPIQGFSRTRRRTLR